MALRTAAVSIALVLCIGMFAVPAAGYPGYWANIARSNCTRLPATNRELSSSPHSAPVLSSALKFELRLMSTGANVSSVCPGGAYKLKLTFPSSSHYMVVSTYGNFSETYLCGGLNSCPNRACNCNSTRRADGECPLSKEVELNITMPANNSLIGTATNVFQAVFIGNSMGGSGTLQANSLSVNFTPCVNTTGNSTGNSTGNTTAPALSLAINATKFQVNQTRRLTIRVVNLPPFAPPIKPGDASSTANITTTPAGILSCSPTSPVFKPGYVATANCTALKNGTVRILASYTVLNSTLKTNRPLRVE